MPLGLMPDMAYEAKENSLREGDGLLFYSDGLVEAHDSKGEMFGRPRLRQLISAHGAGNGEELRDLLLAELERFTGQNWEQEDDITLVTVQRSPRRAPPPGETGTDAT
jgi:serine phosphatase RsbU (regulator of sigma subunit)